MIPSTGDLTTFLQTLQGVADAFAIMFYTPDKFTFCLTGIRDLWQGFAIVANTLMVLFLIIGATQIMISRSTGRASSMTPQELVTKFAIQVIGINFSFPLIQLLVNIENMFCFGLLTFTAANAKIHTEPVQFAQNCQPDTQTNPNNAAFALLQQVAQILGDNNINNNINKVPSPILAIIVIVFLTVLFIVFFQALIRLLRLNLFLVLSPLAFPLLMLEQTREYGSFILRTLVITIYVQFLQVLGFCLTLFLLGSALTGTDSVIKLFMVIGELVAVCSIPRLLSRLGLPSSGPTFGSAIAGATRLASRFRGRGTRSTPAPSTQASSGKKRVGRKPRVNQPKGTPPNQKGSSSNQAASPARGAPNQQKANVARTPLRRASRGNGTQLKHVTGGGPSDDKIVPISTSKPTRPSSRSSGVGSTARSGGNGSTPARRPFGIGIRGTRRGSFASRRRRGSP